jgi:hypothetical protein
VGVDRVTVVATAPDGEVVSLDRVPVHAGQDTEGPAPRSRSGQPRLAVRAAHHEPVAREPGEHALAPRSGEIGRWLAGQERGDDASAGPAVRVLEAPARAVAQPARSGQAEQRGARAVQVVAPSSIIAWLNAAAPPAGSHCDARQASAAGVRRAPSQRSITRRALVSSAATCRSQANEPTAAAV